MEGGYYKWLIVAASFLSHFIFYGIVYGIGVYYVVIEETISVGPTQVSILCSVFTAIFFVTGTLSAVLVNKFGCNRVTMFGGAMGSLGFVMSSFTKDINILYVTFAGVAGVGLGLCGPPSIVIIGKYFKKNSPLAFGISLSGVGCGACAFPPLIRLLVSHYGLSGSLLISGGLCSHLILCGAIYRPMDDKTVRVKTEKEDQESSKRDVFQLVLFKDINFLMLCLHNLLAGFGQSIVFVHMAAYAKDLGFSKSEGAAALSVMGFANWLGRLFFGIIPQVKVVGYFLPLCVGLTLAAFAVATLTFAYTYILFCTVSGAFGFLWGSFGALQPQVTLYVVGQKYLACAFGFLLIFVATGSILGAPTAGYMFETTNTYPMSFYIGATCIIGSAIAAIVPGYNMKLKLQKLKKETCLVVKSGVDV